jgi:hypothetical protein
VYPVYAVILQFSTHFSLNTVDYPCITNVAVAAWLFSFLVYHIGNFVGAGTVNKFGYGVHFNKSSALSIVICEFCHTRSVRAGNMSLSALAKTSNY